MAAAGIRALRKTYSGVAAVNGVEAAPHFIANAGLTLSAWHGWSGSLRMRAINHYRLDEADPAIVTAGLTFRFKGK